MCGIFCYKIQLKRKTIFQRLGYRFDTDMQAFIDDDSIEPIYKNIDFIMCVETPVMDDILNNKQFFMRKNEATGRFVISYEYPTIKNLYSLIRSLQFVN